MTDRVVVYAMDTTVTIDGEDMTVEGCEPSGAPLPPLHPMDEHPEDRVVVAVVCEWHQTPGSLAQMVIIPHVWTGWWFVPCVPGIIRREGWMYMPDYIDWLDL